MMVRALHSRASDAAAGFLRLGEGIGVILL